MIIYDKVKVLNDRPEYAEEGVKRDMVGRICTAEIRDNCFEVCFIDSEMKKDDIFCPIKIKDLEMVECGFGTMKNVWEELPSPDPRWWCVVEDGFIKNFNGEKKNKIAYDYDS